MGGNKGLFYYHLIATYCHVLQKTGKRLRIYTLPFIVKVLTFAP